MPSFIILNVNKTRVNTEKVQVNRMTAITGPIKIGLALGTLGPKWRRRVFAILAALVLLILSLIWKVAQPGYGRQFAFDWDEAKGFTRASIRRPPTSRLVMALVAPMDQFVILQTKPHIPPVVRGLGLKRAMGEISLDTLGPLPIVLGVDILQPWTVVDPEETPLMWAADRGDLGQVKELLAGGANVNAIDQRGNSALIYAGKTFHRNAEVVRSLISAGAAVNAKDNRKGATALIYATENGAQLEVVQELLAGGAEVNARDDRGESPLMNAVFDDGDETSAEVVKVLLAYGADLRAKNTEGETALDIAEKRGKPKVALLLKEAGINR